MISKTLEHAHNDAEYMEIIKDLINNEMVQNLNNYEQHHANTRLEHSINVSYISYLIAKRNNLDFKATARAGLLHDLFFYDWRVTKFSGGSHAYMHPRIALRNAERITTLSPKEKDIIVKHMFGATIAPPKYLEGWVVTLVDKYCATKEFSIGKINKIESILALKGLMVVK